MSRKGIEIRKKKHYATLYKERIFQLEGAVKKYYMANYMAKCRVDWASQNMVIGVTVLHGNEEAPITNDPEVMKKIIMDLPLLDYGC